MSKPTAEQLDRARKVLKGDWRITYEDVRTEHGLDDSFVWTPDTIWPYVEATIDNRINRSTGTVLAGRLRVMAHKLRTMPIPIKDIIPLLQMAADHLEKK